MNRGRFFQVTLASLAARLNDTREISRVMTYTALAAETEVIENLREVLDGLQVRGGGQAGRAEEVGSGVRFEGCFWLRTTRVAMLTTFS